MTGQTETLMYTAIDTATAQPSAAPMRRQGLSHVVLGLTIASLLPALFWTAIVAVVGHSIGSAPSLATLMVVASGITAFLALVVGSIVSR